MYQGPGPQLPGTAARDGRGTVYRPNEQPMYAPLDALTGMTFRTIREQSGLSRHVTAVRVGTTLAVIDALEVGNVAALPDTQELHRIIDAYSVIAAVDLGPIEHRIRRLMAPPIHAPVVQALLQAGVSAGHVDGVMTHAVPAEVRAQPAPNRATSAPMGRAAQPATQPVAAPPPRANRRQLSPLRIVLAGVPLLAVLVIGTTAQTSPQTLLAAADSMPFIMRSVVYSGLAMITPVKTHRAEGLTWIEAVDPRSRKTDRLPVRQARAR
jgi:DNA-binding transcriptional regulator YiaG